MKKLTIGLDLNGVVFIFFLCRFFSEVVIERLFFIVSSQRWLCRITRVVCFFTKPAEGATKHINWLLRDGHEIKIVTSLGDRWLKLVEWLIYRVFGREFEIVCVGYGNSKLKAATDFKLNVFVDSEYRKLISLAGEVDHLFLLSLRGRQNHKHETGTIRNVSSWKELYQKISALSSENIESTST